MSRKLLDALRQLDASDSPEADAPTRPETPPRETVVLHPRPRASNSDMPRAMTITELLKLRGKTEGEPSAAPSAPPPAPGALPRTAPRPESIPLRPTSAPRAEVPRAEVPRAEPARREAPGPSSGTEPARVPPRVAPDPSRAPAVPRPANPPPSAPAPAAPRRRVVPANPPGLAAATAAPAPPAPSAPATSIPAEPAAPPPAPSSVIARPSVPLPRPPRLDEPVADLPAIPFGMPSAPAANSASAEPALEPPSEESESSAVQFLAPRRPRGTNYENRIRAALGNDPLATQYRSLADRLAELRRAFDHLVVTFVGAEDEPHVGEMAAHLALALAERKSADVLLVDGGLLERRLTIDFDRASKEGFAEALNGRKWQDVLLPLATDRLWLLPAGQGKSPPSIDETLPRMFSEMRRRFEFTLLDAGAANQDATVALARLADACFLVARLGQTSTKGLKATEARLQAAGARVVGCVVTNLRPQ